MQNIKADILERYDLIDYLRNRTFLRKVASTGGGEWAGSCPFCGGRDRFRVQPNHPNGGKWMCRNCSPGWRNNVIDFYMKDHGCDFSEAIKELSNRSIRNSSIPRQQFHKVENQSNSKGQEEMMRIAIALCEEKFWGNGNPAAMDYLHKRGLKKSTIKRFHLGYSPGMKVGNLWIPKGITIPNIVMGKIYYMKIRLIPGEACKCSYCRKEMPSPGKCQACGKTTKYLGVKGNRTSSIYNADDLVSGNIAWIVEGEFNAMILFQELNDVVAVASVGSASTRLDLAKWGPYLFYPKLILTTFDEDQSGKKGKSEFLAISEKCIPASLPSHSIDINEFYCNGGDIWAWAKEILDLYDPIE